MAYVWMMRGFYVHKYDRAYANDHYDHAQYVIPQSYRGVSDEQVYVVVGDRLVHDHADPFRIDPQVPPLGKMLYGWSIYLFDNAYVLNIFSFCLASVGVYVLSKVIGLSEKRSFLAGLAFMLQPLVIVQMRKTMLDLLQTALMLWSLTLLILSSRYRGKKCFLTCLCAGIVLGFTACVKFGLFLIPICGALVPFFWRDLRRNLPNLAVILVGFCIGYMIPYATHMQQVGMIQFVKNQKWLVTFWVGAGADIHANRGMPYITIITGLYKHFTDTATWVFQGEWSMLLCVALMYATTRLRLIRQWIFESSASALPMRISFLLLLLYCFVPFYTRYLIMLAPFLILSFISTSSQRLVRATSVVMIFFTMLLLPFYTRDSLTDYLTGLQYNLQQGLYQEIYEASDQKVSMRETRDEFWRRNLRPWRAIEGTHLSLTFAPGWSDHITSSCDIPYTLSYDTALGQIKRTGTVRIRVTGGRRVLVWQDDMIIPHLTKTASVHVQKAFGTPGKVRDRTGLLLAAEGVASQLSIRRREVIDERAVIRLSMQLTGIDDFEVQNAFKTNQLDDQLTFVGTIRSDATTFGELPSGMYVTHLPNVADHLRARYPTAFSVMGGEIIVEDAGKRFEILARQPIDGRDVVLDR